MGGREGARPRGLIPARAGKTWLAPSCERQQRAHPRAGGENSTTEGAVGESTGSSPRGRGKLGLEDGGGLLDRLIPARAGKTMLTH